MPFFMYGIFWNDVDVDEGDDVDRKYWQPITTIARHPLDPVPRISAKQPGVIRLARNRLNFCGKSAQNQIEFKQVKKKRWKLTCLK